MSFGGLAELLRGGGKLGLGLRRGGVLWKQSLRVGHQQMVSATISSETIWSAVTSSGIRLFCLSASAISTSSTAYEPTPSMCGARRTRGEVAGNLRSGTGHPPPRTCLGRSAPNRSVGQTGRCPASSGR